MSKDLFSLDDKVAVVTGATGLLGKHHCRALAQAGANVVAVDLDSEATALFARELTSAYCHDAMGVRTDVRKLESVRMLRDSVIQRFGRIDILVNNAAINDMFENPAAAAELSKFESYPLDLWQASLDVNLTGTFLCCQTLGTEMAAKGKGSIINIASTYGMVAPDQRLYRTPDGKQDYYKSPAYPATKGAVIALTRFIAAYWGEKGVRANTLSPGGVENAQAGFFVQAYSERTPLRRMAAPTDYQGALLFLASDASAYMTGANLVVDGGWTIW